MAIIAKERKGFVVALRFEALQIDVMQHREQRSFGNHG